MYTEVIELLTSQGVLRPGSPKPIWTRSMLQETEQLLKDKTPFLLPDTTIRGRIRAILDGMTDAKHCEVCQAPTPFHPAQGQFTRYCSLKCAHLVSIKSAQKAAQDPENRVPEKVAVQVQRRRDTISQRTYAPRVISEETKAKRKEANQARWGTNTWAEGQMDPAVMEILNSPELLTEILVVSGESLKHVAVRFRIACTTLWRRCKLHGINVAQQRVALLQELRQAPPVDVQQCLSKYNWTMEEAAFIYSTRASQLRKQGYRSSGRASISSTHLLVSNWLTEHNIEHTLNDRKILNGKELDIVIPSHKLAIEINGIQWHGELSGKDKTYHLAKTSAAQQAGYRLIHITGEELNRSHLADICRRKILNACGIGEAIAARACTVKAVPKAQEREFLVANHIQGFTGSVYAYGLYYADDLVMLISFGSARYTDRAEWELLRSASSTRVQGGASKLLAHFRKHHPGSIVSYCDLRWGTGAMYRALGFRHSHNTDPNYRYFLLDDSETTYSRQQFQKHKILSKWPGIDPAKSEWQIMQEKGFDRIWDCGSSVWLLD